MQRADAAALSAQERLQVCGRAAARHISDTGEWPELNPPTDAGITVIDLFAGCGGLSTGFAAIGAVTGEMRIGGAAEINPSAVATYRTNLGIEPVMADLGVVAASVEATDDLRRQFGIPDGQRIVVIGGPPCQGFSSHTKRNKNDADGRNSLVGSFATLAVALGAEVVVMENVPELLSGKHWSHFTSFKDVMETAGYSVTAEIHNLAGFGVPQERFRATIIATRNGDPLMPRPEYEDVDFRTVRDAIGHLPPLTPGRADPTDPQHVCAGHRAGTVEVIKRIPPDGGNRPKGVGPACLDKVDGFRDVYGRLSWNRPANTITGYARNPASGRFVHPEQHRGLSVREAALLQGFPPDFDFEGNFDSRFSQVGNAVPPIYAAHVAGVVLDHMIGCACFQDSGSRHRFLTVVEPTRNSFSSGLISMKSKVLK